MKIKIETRENILLLILFEDKSFQTAFPLSGIWTNQLGRGGESHDLVAAADASHQQAGEHDAHNLEGRSQIIRRHIL